VLIKTAKPELKVVTVSDLHLSAFSPSSRKDDYWESSKKTLRQILGFCVKQEVSVVLIGGDIFHLKSSYRNPLWFIHEVISIFKEYSDSGIPVVGVAGNHDCLYGTFSSIEKQPAGLLEVAGAIHFLDRAPVLISHPSCEVKVVGRSFGADAVKELLSEPKGKEDYLVGVGHFWFGPQSGNFFGEQVWSPDSLNKSEIDLFFIGHHHADQGIQRIGNKVYCVHGSMSLTGSHKHDIERKPSIGLLTFAKGGIKSSIVRLKVPNISELFDLEKQAQVVSERENLDGFLQSLSQDFGSKGWEESYKDMSLEPKVRDLIDYYIEAAGQ